MGQKLVSFEVAKALKEAGYPQATEYWYSQDGGICYSLSDLSEVGYISRPSYLDAWLWREKGITLEPSKEGILVLECEDENGQLYYSHNIYSQDENKDPEKLIIAGINHLVKNNSII